MTNERENYYIRLIKESFSFFEVCKKADIVATTGNYNTLKGIVKKNNIDISHFKRQHSKVVNRIKLEDVLENKRYINAYRLTRLLLKSGLKERKCENPECGITEWYGQPIKIVAHHINGDSTDNRLENIMFLCPNCHSYTDNFGGKNIRTEERFCFECGKKLTSNQKKFCCVDCMRNNKKKHKQDTIKKEKRTKCPPKEVLIEDISYLNIRLVGEKYGVSDKAVCKWLNKYDLPTKCKEIGTFLKENGIEDKRYRKK